MKIAFIIEGFGIGGTELNATRTLEALTRRGIRVNVIHLHRDGELYDRVAATGHQMWHVPIVPLRSPKIAISVATMASTLRSIRASVVHTQDVYTNILGIAAGRMLLRRPVLTSRRWKDEVPRKELTPLNAWAHRRSTLVLPNSGALTTTLVAEGVRKDRIVVHENFLDDHALTLFSPSRVAEWRAELGIPVEALVIGCVARLSKVKRHDVLLDAFARIRSSVPSAHLVLIGDGDERRALVERARVLGVESAVTFTGTLPNTPLSQQLFDVAALMSENEGFPNSLIEAAACGVPLVATPVGGVPDVLVEGVTGLSVAVGDVHATERALTTLLHDTKMRLAMGAAGRSSSVERFSEESAMQRLLGCYARASGHH